jgi:hypothetical protein
MLDGNMFFDEQGMPILKIALNRILFEEALPEPFSVATQILRSLIDGVSKCSLLIRLSSFLSVPYSCGKTTC